MLNNNIKIDLHIHSKASEYKESEGCVSNRNTGRAKNRGCY